MENREVFLKNIIRSSVEEFKNYIIPIAFSIHSTEIYSKIRGFFSQILPLDVVENIVLNSGGDVTNTNLYHMCVSFPTLDYFSIDMYIDLNTIDVRINNN